MAGISPALPVCYC